MAVKVHKFPKSVSTQQNNKPSVAKTSAKKQKQSFFEALLSGLRPKKADHEQQTHAIQSFRSRPATSNIIKQDRSKPSNIARHSLPPAPQNVNNMAASALITLTALSSGRNRLSNFYNNAALSSRGISSSSAQQSSRSTGLSGMQASNGIGALSAQFESGDKGIDIIGYDRQGGTCYGTYQISSKAGSMRQFIDYLSNRAPALAQKLKAAGTANTGSRQGRMPDVWRQIATENPEQFADLQHDFVEETHYLPALQEIAEKTGVDISQQPRAVQEVLWSTAVQHGPKGAVKIFSKAVAQSQTKNGGVQMAKLIGSVYAMRAGQFQSSDPEVKSAVRNRFRQEGRIALAMLSNPFLRSDGVRA